MKLSMPRGFSGDFRPFSTLLDRWFPTPRFLEPATVGVDVSDVSIKWVAFDAGKRVRSWGTIPLAPGIVVNGVIKNVEALSEALRALLPHGITEAHAALPEETAYVFSMSVPDDIAREQILRMVEFEFEGRVPITPQASVYDFDYVSSSPKNSMRDIGVVVFPRELADHYAAAFEMAGIRLLSLELEARSIARAVSVPGITDGSVVLLVDFGRLRSGIAVLKQDIPIFTTTVAVGGDAIEQGLMKCMACTENEAEQFRNSVGLEADSASHKEQLEVIMATTSVLAAEIERYHHFWDTRKGSRDERSVPVSRIVLVGGSSNLRGLPEYLAPRIHASVSRGDVWHNIFSYDEYIPPITQRESLGYATAIGLAMRGFPV